MTTRDTLPDPYAVDVLDDLAETMHDARKTAAENGLTISDKDADPLCDAEVAATETIEGRGFPVLGVGAARVVCALDDAHVVKFARYGADDLTDGVIQNHREVRIYDSVGEKYRLLPVVAANAETEKWVVMPRIDPVAETPDEELDDYSDLIDLKDELAPLFDYIHFPEINPQNVAYYQGELHLFDYGRPPVPLEDM